MNDVGCEVGCCKPKGDGWRPRRWTWGGLTAVFVGVATALFVGQAAREREALAQPATVVTSPSTYYKQAVVPYTRTSETIVEWVKLGWEPFQIVPVANPNPSTGGAMQVLIVFRK